MFFRIFFIILKSNPEREKGKALVFHGMETSADERNKHKSQNRESNDHRGTESIWRMGWSAIYLGNKDIKDELEMLLDREWESHKARIWITY